MSKQVKKWQGDDELLACGNAHSQVSQRTDRLAGRRTHLSKDHCYGALL